MGGLLPGRGVLGVYGGGAGMKRPKRVRKTRVELAEERHAKERDIWYESLKKTASHWMSAVDAARQSEQLAQKQLSDVTSQIDAMMKLITRLIVEVSNK